MPRKRRAFPADARRFLCQQTLLLFKITGIQMREPM